MKKALSIFDYIVNGTIRPSFYRDIANMENIALRKVRAWGDLAMKKFINN
jgi:hypothetical protein